MYTKLKIYFTKAARQRAYLLLVLLVGGILFLRFPLHLSLYNKQVFIPAYKTFTKTPTIVK
jgi:hypothetical protein